MLYCSITDKENIHISQTEGLEIPGGGGGGGWGGMHLKEMYEMYEVQLVFHRVLIKKIPSMEEVWILTEAQSGEIKIQR